MRNPKLPDNASTPNDIPLTSTLDGTITSVNVYRTRAEVTRVFKVNLEPGMNKLVIVGLPTAMERDSLRVEGRGSDTVMIHDVSVRATTTRSKAANPWQHTLPALDSRQDPVATSPTMSALTSKERLLRKAIRRSERALTVLEDHISDISHTRRRSSEPQVIDVEAALDMYERKGRELTEREEELKRELSKVRAEIRLEAEKESKALQQDIEEPIDLDKLGTQVTVNLFADVAEEFEAILIYAVRDATWYPAYDIRVNMQEPRSKSKSKMDEKASSKISVSSNCTLVYRGVIRQSTGEDWTNATLSLETANPTFNLKDEPKLAPWTIQEVPPPIPISASHQMPIIIQQPPTVMHLRGRSPSSDTRLRRDRYNSSGSRGRSRSRSRSRSGEHARMSMPPVYQPPPVQVRHRVAEVINPSPGHTDWQTNATFRIAGRMTVPSDNEDRNVVIASIALDAAMNWVCVPKLDARVKVKAKLKNASEFTLLPGTASVFVDGSFISTITLPLVSPDETFECPLGLDPSIRVTYHPVSKKSTTVTPSSGFGLGFGSKNTPPTTTHVLIQKISIFNSKSITLRQLKILDQIPISNDGNVVVKLVNPPLQTSSAVVEGRTSSSTTGRGGESLRGHESLLPGQRNIQVQEGVIAAWNGVDEPDVDANDLGKDGKIKWLLEVAPQATVNLTLHSEVVVTGTRSVFGI